MLNGEILTHEEFTHSDDKGKTRLMPDAIQVNFETQRWSEAARGVKGPTEYVSLLMDADTAVAVIARLQGALAAIEGFHASP